MYCAQVGGVGSSNSNLACCYSNCNGSSGSGSIVGGIGSTPTTCNCAQINSSIFQLQLQVADLEQAVYTDILTVINGIAAQITVLNQRT